MNYHSVKLLLFLLALMITVNAQTERWVTDRGLVLFIDKPKEVILQQSWKKGVDTFKNQLIRVRLSSKNKSFRKEVVSDSGRKYLIKTVHNPYSDKELEHWEIQIFEITDRKAKTRPRDNLLIDTYSPLVERGDYPGIFYPEEEPGCFGTDSHALWGECSNFFYFKTVRKVNIENYCFTLQVEDYKFNPVKKTKLDLLEIIIKFSARCKPDN